MGQRLPQGADRRVVALAQLAKAQALVGFQHAAQDVLAHLAQHLEGGGILAAHVLRRRRRDGHFQDIGHWVPQIPR
jgi:hypothetical protein